MVEGVVRRAGFLVLSDLVGPRAPTLRARRLASGTRVQKTMEPDGAEAGPAEGMTADAIRAAETRRLRVRLVDLLTTDADLGARAALVRELTAMGRPLPAGVLRALASLARDGDPRVRRGAAATLVHLLEAMDPMAKSGLIVRLATSSRFELRLLVAQALRYGSLCVGAMSALEYLVDDPESDVSSAALVSARLRLAEAPDRIGSLVKRKLGR